MNEMPPQQPPYTPPPGGQPPQQPYQSYEQDDPTKKLKVWLAVVCVAALGLIVGAYLFGVKTGEDKYKPGEPGYQEIYADGQAAGATTGAKAGKAKGEAEGQAEGKEEGKKQGISEGQEEGVQQGADAALGGLSGWSTETPYVVEFSEGPNSNVPVAISARWLMQPGINYRICSDGSGVCQVSQSSGSDSGGDSGGGGGGSGSTGSTP
jgi:hypothetical protein